MPNPNHDAKGQFSSGGDSGSHGTGVNHTGNAGVSKDHQAQVKAMQQHLAEERLQKAQEAVNKLPAQQQFPGQFSDARDELARAKAGLDPNSKDHPSGGWRGPVRD